MPNPPYSLWVTSMLLALMRHGKAEPKGEKPDELRSLTSEGFRDVESVAGLLPFKPSIVYSSPYRRAIQTAEVVASRYGVKVSIVEELKPGVFTVDSLRKINVRDRALLVGHAPSIELVLSSLIGGGSVKMKASSIAIIEVEELDYSMATLIALLIPPTVRL